MEVIMWPWPKILAHRGGGVLAPENTLAGLQCGLEYGFHAVEFDVMLSRDEVPILMHDPVFGRTVAGSGQVAQTDAHDLLQMDAGAWFRGANGESFQGEKVPSFAQVLAFCQANGIWMNIEIKPSPGFEVRTGEVVAQHAWAWFRHRPTDGWPLLSSFSVPALAAAQQVAPLLPRGLLMDQVDTPDWLKQAHALQAVALHTNQKTMTASLAQAVKQTGLGLFCYTVNQPERARQLFEWGVDGFCTDRIDLIGPIHQPNRG
jgi:glycerophosphoryl diester phosphodiesterase